MAEGTPSCVSDMGYELQKYILIQRTTWAIVLWANNYKTTFLYGYNIKPVQKHISLPSLTIVQQHAVP